MSGIDFLSDAGLPIPYYVGLNPLTGGMAATIFLQQLLYWRGAVMRLAAKEPTEPCAEEHADGWFYKSRQEWMEELGISRRDLDSARARFRDQGWLEEREERLIHRTWYRVHIEPIRAAWDTLTADPSRIHVPPFPNVQNDIRELPDRSLGEVQNDIPDSPDRTVDHLNRDHVQRSRTENPDRSRAPARAEPLTKKPETTTVDTAWIKAYPNGPPLQPRDRTALARLGLPPDALEDAVACTLAAEPEKPVAYLMTVARTKARSPVRNGAPPENDEMAAWAEEAKYWNGKLPPAYRGAAGGTT